MVPPPDITKSARCCHGGSNYLGDTGFRTRAALQQLVMMMMMISAVAAGLIPLYVRSCAHTGMVADTWSYISGHNGRSVEGPGGSSLRGKGSFE